MTERGRRALAALLTGVLLAGCLGGCALVPSRQTVTYLDAFDTVTTVTAYGLSADRFAADTARLYEEMLRYHRLYDIYTDYDGINNLKTVNEAQGAAVAVDEAVLELLEYGKEAYGLTDGRVNVLFGSVLKLWHDSRRAALENASDAALPDKEALVQAAAHCDPACLRIDREAGTVQLTDPSARLDVGAIAKGFAAERLAAFAKQILGWDSALLDVGGNIRAVGQKSTAFGDRPYTIGIRNPDADSAKGNLLTVAVSDKAVVTSGDYQRYFTVNGQDYHHIIDVDTLYPAAHVRAVTVICSDSGLADVLSTALFTLPIAEGKNLLNRCEDAEAVWVLSDGSMQVSANFLSYEVT